MKDISVTGEADLIKIPSAVDRGCAAGGQALFPPEYIKMPDPLLQVIGDPVEFFLVEIFECFSSRHNLKLRNSNNLRKLSCVLAGRKRWDRVGLINRSQRPDSGAATPELHIPDTR